MTMFQMPSKKQIDKAGDALRVSGADPDALAVISSWRGAHAYMLNSFQTLQRNRIRKKLPDCNIILAQRLKRLPSIISKLNRFPTMHLSRMQDIGGIRIIVKSADDMDRAFAITAKGSSAYKVIQPPRDYIAIPKPDGYRSLHQYFQYTSKAHPELNGLRLELQLRTRLQHSWATAVETLGIIERQSFKTGEGDEAIRRFFKVVSALFSIAEKRPVLAEFADWTRNSLIEELKTLDAELAVTSKLRGIVIAKKDIKTTASESYCYVLILDSQGNHVSMVPFAQSQMSEAERFYLDQEEFSRNNPRLSVVLISAGGLTQIRKAYPNYFLDTKLFLDSLNKVLG